MKLYIQIVNGQPVNHPAFEDNLISAFGEVPNDWQAFNRIQQPDNLINNPFQKIQNSYALSADGITWQDVWTVIDMTSDEKQALVAETKANPPGPNLTLNTDTLQWSPSIKIPFDGKNYLWNYQTGEWVLIQT